jgi:hypothetical protein
LKGQFEKLSLQDYEVFVSLPTSLSTKKLNPTRRVKPIKVKIKTNFNSSPTLWYSAAAFTGVRLRLVTKGQTLPPGYVAGAVSPVPLPVRPQTEQAGIMGIVRDHHILSGTLSALTTTAV